MHSTDNDMDDLFKEAAENYPLKVSGADWGKVQAGLSDNYTPVPAPQQKRNKERLWLLLLLLIPLMCNQLRSTTAYKNIPAGTQLATTHFFITAPQTQSTADKNNARVSHRRQTPATGSGTAQQPLAGAPTTIITEQPAKVAGTAGDLFNTYGTTGKTKGNTKSNVRTAAAVKNIITNAGDDNIATGNNANTILLTQRFGRQLLPEILSRTKILALQGKSVNITTGIAAESITQHSQHKQPKPEVKQPKLYIAIMGGKDASRVKNEDVDHLGLSTGLTIGYRLNKRFAIEAGAYYAKKYYNADIKYFNNSKTMWPDNRIITNLEGVCRMIEIPISLRYNFAVKNKSSFFATAGLSSYLMKKEDYEYNYTTSTNWYSMEVYKTYKNSGQNWASVLQLSAGWQKRLGKITSLRVQPFYNLPLKGVGIGKLPISGVGLQAGISFAIK